MNIETAPSSIEPARPVAVTDALYRKIGLRFVPLLFVCYIMNYMDRTNIGFAQLQMKGDLKLSDIAYGIGAGMFFASYSAFTLPTSLLLKRMGARRIIFLCLFGWGIVSSCTLFVHGAYEFYAIRFLLGVVEAGFFPAVVYYFGLWYPAQRRAGVIGIFTAATVAAGIVSSLLSGAIMNYMSDFAHLRGWQWLFLLEGLPAAVLGIVVYFYLDEGPASAKWLTGPEKSALVEAIDADPAASSSSTTLRHAILDWRVYVIAIIYFLAVFDTFTLAFWQPQMIKAMGVSNVMAIGVYSAIPLVAAIFSKVYVGWSSDRHHELRWHFAVPALLGAVGFALAGMYPHNLVIGIASLALATAGAHGCIPIVWAAPGLYLSGTAVASGIAIVSTVGTISGFVGPGILGYIRTVTGSFAVGSYVLGGILALAAVLMLVFIRAKTLRPANLQDGD